METKVEIEQEMIRRIEGPPALEVPEGFWDDLKARLRNRTP